MPIDPWYKRSNWRDHGLNQGDILTHCEVSLPGLGSAGDVRAAEDEEDDYEERLYITTDLLL